MARALPFRVRPLDAPRALLLAALGVLLSVLSGEVRLQAVGSADAIEYALTVWAAENGQPPGDIFAIAQGPEGYLWLGTPTGLVRFDGSKFVRWPPPHRQMTLPAGPVHAIVGSSDGSLWVGFGGGGGVVRIDGDRAIRFDRSTGAPPGVTAMIQDREGAIWVAGRRGVFRFADGRWTKPGPAEGYSGEQALSLYEDRNGDLWVGAADGVYRWADGRFELVDAAATQVQSFAEDESGAIWVTDPRYIVRKLGSDELPATGEAVRLPSAGWRVLRDGHGQLWVATFGGLLRIRNPTLPEPLIERFAYEHELAGSPRSVFEDSEQNIWVGMRGGLLRLSERSFESVVPLDGLTNDGVRTAAVGRDGSIWVATGHALNRFSGGTHTSYSVPQPMALHEDRHGRLWVATAEHIGWLEDGTLVPVSIPDARRVMAITTDARGRLWLCSSLKGIMAWDGERLERFEHHPAVFNRSCHSVYRDGTGRIWIGFLGGGAAVYDGAGFRTFGQEEGLTSGTVLAILEDRNGTIWISTSGGVNRYANGRFTRMTPANAPLIDIVPVLVEDEAGYLWVGVNSGAGILRFHPREIDKVAASSSHLIEYALFDESDGLQQGSQTWQAGVGGVRGTDGRLWVATGLGMSIIEPARLPPRRPSGPPQVESVLADGRWMAPVQAVTLPAGTSTLQIEYGAISLSSASKLRFRYRLEGLDTGWVYAGAAREATYTGVPPGDYQFHVSASDSGLWTEGVSWTFSVAAPFYRTSAFFVLVAAAVVLTLTSAWWLRLRAVRRQYALVFAERTRVSREIHDTLLQSLAAIGVELETVLTQLDPAQTGARDALRRLRRQVGRSVREARDSILELRHAPTTRPALADRLQELADSVTTMRRVPTAFSVTGRPRSGSTETDLQLLRIGQEAVTNAVKHAQATRIDVSLTYERARAVLVVRDNGRGFTPGDYDPPPPSGEHLGLITMRERAARVRGHVTIDSTPGAGTTVEAVVPLESE